MINRAKFGLMLAMALTGTLLLTAGCFSPWTGDGMGNITIVTGGPGGSRLLQDTSAFKGLTCELTLPGGLTVPMTEDKPGSYTAMIPYGRYEIVFRGYEMVLVTRERPGRIKTVLEKSLVAEGGGLVDLSPKKPFGTIAIKIFSITEANGMDVLSFISVPVYVDKKDGKVSYAPVTNTEEKKRPEIFVLRRELGSLPGRRWNFNGLIDIENNYKIPMGDYDPGDPITVDRAITLRGEYITLVRGEYYNNPFFVVKYGGTLTMEGVLTLDGNGFDSEVPLIIVEKGGTLILNDGIKLVNNVNKNDAPNFLGGAVRVNGGGELIMDGGSIEGNTAETGGGVYVAQDGLCIMNGGLITGNTALGYTAGPSSAGGVHVINGGIVKLTWMTNPVSLTSLGLSPGKPPPGFINRISENIAVESGTKNVSTATGGILQDSKGNPLAARGGAPINGW